MESIRWHPIRQEYIAPRNNHEPLITRIEAERHNEALFAALVTGGMLLKLVTPGGAQLTFIPGDHKALAPTLVAGPEKVLPKLSGFEEKTNEETVASALAMLKR
ncbi:hypothetical protein LXT21_43815 [Myxococcus sp. K38C18041901]|uniref:hypothetical protein n=1 Tax=Myxococcus guangdongensis TaxID=2906760 RepID=UPI0020A6E618|nr:hypothetical protein [Myxococcus guangdongensis]MCP3065718.1 hypothetical protein [Myxococcus guangdongensis]